MSEEGRLRRVRPLLGTFVRIELAGAAPDVLAEAAARAFDAVADVHARMSFHDPASELSRLNRAPVGMPVPLSPALASVLGAARTVSSASAGVFDPVRAATLAVVSGALPKPRGGLADPDAGWRDLDLREGDRTAVRRRPLWVDLGGIAKGFAVDAAVDALQAAGVPEGLVDAGGDLRVFGPAVTTALHARAPGAPVPRLELADAALAASGGLDPDDDRLAAQAHTDGRDGRPVAGVFAAVIAPRALWADALTKVVLALGEEAAPVLHRFGARALRLAAGEPWREIGGLAA